MKMLLISDNTDTLTGMRLAGVDGVVVHTREETLRAIKEAAADRDCGVVLLTMNLRLLCDDFLSDFMKKNAKPLFQTIPDRHGEDIPGSSVTDFIEKSIGLKLNEFHSRDSAKK